MKWPEDFIDQIICGDCLEVMKGFPNDCIDTIITDPPYGLEFMGKDWDKLDNKHKEGEWIPCETCDGKGIVIEGNIEMACLDCLGGGYELNPKRHDFMQRWHYNWAIEALRIAKPGATLLCFGGTRTYHRLACAIEDAGWILKDCIMWIYGSGFPKASDISKQLDKRAGAKRIDLGKHPNARKTCGNINICKKNGSGRLTAPATPEATLWNGWKSHGLKPAYEPILVAMKPNEGSYASNALKYGVAGLNIDGGRIGTDVNRGDRYGGKAPRGVKNPINITGKREKIWNVPKGRYPANVILDEESARLLDEQAPRTGAFAKVKSGHSGKSKGIYHDYVQRGDDGETFYNDGLQGASRFFYCAKASKAERNRGCEGLSNKLITTHKGKYRKCKKCGKRAMSGTKEQIQYRCQCENPDWEIVETDNKIYITKNNHPTVKPLALMKYLCTLTKTPTGGIVLDPFCGSGTTLMACKELKRNYIGIDNIPEYCEIARKRVSSISEPLF